MKTKKIIGDCKGEKHVIRSMAPRCDCGLFSNAELMARVQNKVNQEFSRAIAKAEEK